MFDTKYNVLVFPIEGETQLQVEVLKDSGHICLTLFSSVSASVSKLKPEETKRYKQKITLTSDADIKSIIEALQWARKNSLEEQGYKVIL
tara:strand:- start:945 stop:1214 length:270 start_codon:yes stop_codon:yes gene_type:complete